MGAQPEKKADAYQYIDYLQKASYSAALDVYRDVLNNPRTSHKLLAFIAENDRYFLTTTVLKIDAAYDPWVYERCREVEQDPDGYIDLWAREHFKSTLITYAGVFQEVIRDPELTVGIFSHNTKHARGQFIRRFMREMETNGNLHTLWPEVFYKDPKKESPLWSRDEGLILKRKKNPSEPTISGWGIIDGMPTGFHFSLNVYDDVVTEKSVTTPDMIEKTDQSWELSLSLTKRRKDGSTPRVWYIGTRYNYGDTYQRILDRNVAVPRLYPATDDGTVDGKPVLLKDSEWERIKSSRSISTIACQYLQNPLEGGEQKFKLSWIRRWEIRPATLNVAIAVDPANSKKKGTSNTAMAVIGIDAQHNKYLLDGCCHKMSLTERWVMLKNIRNKWVRQPGIQTVKVGYERYGMQADIEHIKEMQLIEKCHFPIEELSWAQDVNSQRKDDRIDRLIPDHENWRWFYPYEGEVTSLQMQAMNQGKVYLVSKPILRKNHEGKIYNLVDWMIKNEYIFYPATTQKDFLDAMSRFYDLKMNPPQIYKESDVYPEPEES